MQNQAEKNNSVRDLLAGAAERGIAYREGCASVSPYPQASARELRVLFNVGLNEKGRPGEEVISHLADIAEQGLVGISSNSFYGWVMGSSHPVGVAADWLTSSWAQNSAIYQTAPSAAMAEEVAGNWLLDILNLPKQSSFAFTTGATMASFICLAAARSEVLLKNGWDLEENGMFGAPEIKVFLSEEAHSTIYSGLRNLGFGKNRLIQISADENGRMLTADLISKIYQYQGPKIIIAQAGHINSAAFDDFTALADIAQETKAWLHVDGAFGLWAHSTEKYKHLCQGVDRADSWSIDGHKLLQVPYDSGYAIIKNATAHKRAMDITASYLNENPEDGRNPGSFGPELSRRARGFTLWAVLQTLGREGIEDLIHGNCHNAERLAEKLGAEPDIDILHELYFNQVAISFKSGSFKSGSFKSGSVKSDNSAFDGEEITKQTIHRLQEQQQWFLKEAAWKNRTILRISFSSIPNSDEEIDQLAGAIIEAFHYARDKEIPSLNTAT